MSESVTLTELDRRLVAALQLNGRASWKQVARAVGATESTVARRGQLVAQIAELEAGATMSEQRIADLAGVAP